jgi:hypothetical protein
MNQLCKRPSFTRLWLPLALAAFLVAGVVAAAGAAIITWSNPAGGAWSNAANWTPAEVPDAAGESAVLPDLGGAYQVTLDIEPAIDGLRLEAGAATLALNGKLIGSPGLFIGAGSSVRGAGVLDIPEVNNFGLIEGSVPGDSIKINGIVANRGTIRVINGGTVNVNRPLVMNFGTIASGPGGGRFSIKMPFDVGGTLNHMRSGGKVVADGGDLQMFTGSWLEGTVDRGPGGGAVNIEIATLQNVTVAEGAELGVTGLANLMAAGTSLTNNGTVRVKGTIGFGILDGGYEIYIGGKGTMVLDGGTLGYGNGSILVNRAGQTITGCGTINPPFVNQGTVSLDCGGSQVARFPGSFVNRGRLNVLRGSLAIGWSGPGVLSGRIVPPAVVTNRGTISAGGGTITIEKGATVDNAGGVLSADGGKVNLGGATGATVTGGRLDGSLGLRNEKVGMLRGGPGFAAVSFQVDKAATLRDVTLGSGATLLTAAGAVTRVEGASFVNLGTNRVQGTLVVAPGTRYVEPAGAALVVEGGAVSGLNAKPVATPTSAFVPATLRFYARNESRGTSFVLELPQAAELKGRLYDAAGREVARLADGMKGAGVHDFAVDATVPNGIYFARMIVTRQGASDVLSARVAVVH